ncbi:MAG: hypothetical protein U0Q12_03060 [Vicinamibacterales bacterium]
MLVRADRAKRRNDRIGRHGNSACAMMSFNEASPRAHPDSEHRRTPDAVPLHGRQDVGDVVLQAAPTTGVDMTSPARTSAAHFPRSGAIATSRSVNTTASPRR